MKSYTDIEQSKKLAEILPLKSADMWWPYYYDVVSDTGEYDKEPMLHKPISDTEHTIPCWSLAALIELIPDECRMEKTPLDQTGEFTYSFVDDYYNIRTYEEDNLVDACYEMILKLHELNLL